MTSPAGVGSLAALLLWLAMPVPGNAQIDAFRFDSTRVPVGSLYEYLKSNRDGTHPSPVSLYVARIDRIESLKWSPGDTTATLVVAELDWDRFSVRRFESWGLAKGAVPELRATLEADPSGAGVRISFQPDSLITVTAWPWHSYDFDFASLNLAMAHLLEPESPFRFERVDVVYEGPPPNFADLGSVGVRFVAREERLGRQTRLYQLSGPGLSDRRGNLWTAVDGGYLVEFELPFPDEPGFTDVRFRLQSVAEISPADWEAYKRERIGDL
jgi:hypothetical protein